MLWRNTNHITWCNSYLVYRPLRSATPKKRYKTKKSSKILQITAETTSQTRIRKLTNMCIAAEEKISRLRLENHKLTQMNYKLTNEQELHSKDLNDALIALQDTRKSRDDYRTTLSNIIYVLKFVALCGAMMYEPTRMIVVGGLLFYAVFISTRVITSSICKKVTSWPR